MKPSKTPVYLEFKETSAYVLDGEQGAEFPIEREANGRFTAASATLFTNALRGFVQRHGVSGPRHAICALPARGVTLRTIPLPSTAKDDPRRLLTMQIEAQFPVAPAELHWGFERLPENADGAAKTEYLVAAIKREAMADYISALDDCGLAAVFTVAALVRAANSPPAASRAHLEIGVERSELMVIDESGRPSLRVLKWGAQQAGDVDGLCRLLPSDLGTALSVSSGHLPVQPLCAELGKTIPAAALPFPSAPGVTAATHGLRTMADQGRSLLFLGAQEQVTPKSSAPMPWKWPVVAAGLLLLAVSLRYAEAMFFQSQVTAKLGELNKYRGTLPKVEKELSFLSYIKTNQPPYLDTISVVAKAAPPNTRLDQISVVRRGEVSLRGSVQNPQGPEQFRSKLIDSGFFSKVIVEEQGPAGQDRNKLNFRIIAILKADGARPALPPDPPSTNKTSTARGGGPGSPPPGMPPGMNPSMPMDMPPGMPPGVRSRPMPPNMQP